MSSLKLFRREALKNQYRSQEFGESLIETPPLINNSILALATIVLFFLALLAVWPVSITKDYQLSVDDSNYSPLVSSLPVVVERHLPISGAEVAAKQDVVQVRLFDTNENTEKLTILSTPSSGAYFAVANNTGRALAPFEPIAKVLKKNIEHQYRFSAPSDIKRRVVVGQQVQLSYEQHQVSGVIQAVQGPFRDSQELRLIIRLSPPYDAALLNPAVTLQLRLMERQNNIFALLD